MKTKRKIKLKGKIKKIGFRVEAKPLNEEQIQYFIKYHKQYNSFPGSKIPCTISGKLTTCVGPWMTKKIKEFGGVENLLRNYKCRGVLKKQKQIIKPVKQKKNKKAILKDETESWSIPKIDFTPPRALTEVELMETTKSQCLRPDIYLSNGRHCEGCEFFNLCQNDLKRLPKYKN